MRVSNFLLWQIAYAEIWVTDALWPDFRARHLLEAIVDYQKRDRRYGAIGVGGRRRRQGVMRIRRRQRRILLIAIVVGDDLVAAVVGHGRCSPSSPPRLAARSWRVWRARRRAPCRALFVGLAAAATVLRVALSAVPAFGLLAVGSRRRAARARGAGRRWRSCPVRQSPLTLAPRRRHVFAPMYVGLPLGVLAWVQWLLGPGAITWLIGVIAVSDSAQYYTGRRSAAEARAGSSARRKRVEGAVGGLVAARRSPAARSPRGLAGRGAAPSAAAARRWLLAVFGIVGDLFESLLKRSAGVKDSSALIPDMAACSTDRQPPLRRAGLLSCSRSYVVDEAPRDSRIDRIDRPERAGCRRGASGSPRVVALAAGENAALLAEQVRDYRPAVVAVATEPARRLRARLGGGTGIAVRRGRAKGSRGRDAS